MMDRFRALVLSFFFGSLPPSAFAETPQVAFDLPYTVACRDVSPPQADASERTAQAGLLLWASRPDGSDEAR